MLANLLAIVVALGSLAFYLAAFFLPEVHRKSDFLWSGVGLFYGLVLWFGAGQMTGVVILGQTASVALVLWLGFQTLQMRRMTTPLAQQTPISFTSGTGDRQRLTGLPTRRRTNLEYEFVEDADNPISELDEQPLEIKSLAQPTSFDLSVPAAASPTPSMPLETPVKSPLEAPESSVKGPVSDVAAKTPSTVVGTLRIIADWFKEIFAGWTQSKVPQPMIELPPRPPSIPRSKSASVSPADAETSEPEGLKNPPPQAESSEDLVSLAAEIPEVMTPEHDRQPQTIGEDEGLETPRDAIQSDKEIPVEIPETANWSDDDEDTNWPDDDFF